MSSRDLWQNYWNEKAPKKHQDHGSPRSGERSPQPRRTAREAGSKERDPRSFCKAVRLAQGADGAAPLGLVVADWSRMAAYAPTTTKLGWQPVQYSAEGFTRGKNGGDIAMVIEATQLVLKQRTRQRFVIMSGDVDFMPLLSFMKQRGHEVWIMAVEGATSSVLVEMADRAESIGRFTTPAEPEAGSLCSLGQGITAPATDTISMIGHLRRLGFYLKRGSAGLVELVYQVAADLRRQAANAWDSAFRFAICDPGAAEELFERPCPYPALLATSLMKLLCSTKALMELGEEEGIKTLGIRPELRNAEDLVQYLRNHAGPEFLECMALGPDMDQVVTAQGWKAWPAATVNWPNRTVQHLKLKQQASEPLGDKQRGWVGVKDYPHVVAHRHGAPFDTLFELGQAVGWNMRSLGDQLLALDKKRGKQGK